MNWRDALDLPGSTLVGHVGGVLSRYAFTDMTPMPDDAGGSACVGVRGRFYCVYLPVGGDVTLRGLDRALPFQWFDPKAGTWHDGGTTTGATFAAKTPSAAPWVPLVGEPTVPQG